jgi:hypothetical protein
MLLIKKRRSSLSKPGREVFNTLLRSLQHDIRYRTHTDGVNVPSYAKTEIPQIAGADMLDDRPFTCSSRQRRHHQRQPWSCNMAMPSECITATLVLEWGIFTLEWATSGSLRSQCEIEIRIAWVFWHPKTGQCQTHNGQVIATSMHLEAEVHFPLNDLRPLCSQTRFANQLLEAHSQPHLQGLPQTTTANFL